MSGLNQNLDTRGKYSIRDISNSKILYNHHLRIKYRQSDSSFPHFHSLITFCPIVKHADRNHCLLLCCSHHHHHHLDYLPCPNCGHQNAPLGHLFGNLSLFPFLLHTAQNIQICFTMLLQQYKGLKHWLLHARNTKHKDVAFDDSNITCPKQH